LPTNMICTRDTRSLNSALHANSGCRAIDVEVEGGRVVHAHGSGVADDVLMTREKCHGTETKAFFGSTTTSSTRGRYDGIPSVTDSLGSCCKAALFDGPECVRELLSAHADANARDLVGSTPLHKAVANGDKRALRLLIGAGADINAMNIYGDTCVHRAVENVRLATLVELLRLGADMDQPNKLGDAPLHLACAIGNVALVRALLSAGAVALCYNMRGHVPLHTAIQSGQRRAL